MLASLFPRGGNEFFDCFERHAAKTLEAALLLRDMLSDPKDAERDDAGTGRVFRRGFTLASGERVLVVDDIMTTGGSVQETIAAVRAAGGAVAGASVLVDRSGGAAESDIPVHSLWRLEIPTYAPAECPLCAKGIPVTHPGTTPAPVAAPR